MIKTAVIDGSVHNRIKLIAAQRGMQIGVAIHEALEQYADREELKLKNLKS